MWACNLVSHSIFNAATSSFSRGGFVRKIPGNQIRALRWKLEDSLLSFNQQAIVGRTQVWAWVTAMGHSSILELEARPLLPVGNRRTNFVWELLRHVRAFDNVL